MNTQRTKQMTKFVEMVNEHRSDKHGHPYVIRESFKEKKNDKWDHTFSIYQLRKKFEQDVPEEEREFETSTILHDPRDLFGGAKGFGLNWYIGAKIIGDPKDYDCVKPYIRFF